MSTQPSGPPENPRAGGWTPPTHVPPPPVGAPQPTWAPPVRNVADYWSRVGAAVIDFFVRLGIMALGAGIGAILFVAGEEAGTAGLLAGAIVGAVVGSFVYAPVLMARWDGRTVGHRATSTRVVMADGSRMSGGRAFVREVLVKNLLMEAAGSFTFYLLTLLNYLWPLWDPRNEALHDKIVRTLVIDDRVA